MKIFSQRDPRWCNVIYSARFPHTETIKTSGCGICAACTVISNLTDTIIEPPEMAKYAVKRGHRIDGVGTAFSLYSDLANKYNLECYTVPDIYQAINCVRNNGLVVCSTNGGKNKLFSTGGHLFVMSDIVGNIAEFIDSDVYPGKYNTSYRRTRCTFKNNRIYVNIGEAKKHISKYICMERKNKMDKNIYSYDNTVEHMIRLHITDKANMEHWEKCLAGKENLNKDEVRTIFDRFIKELYKK